MKRMVRGIEGGEDFFCHVARSECDESAFGGGYHADAAEQGEGRG